MHSAITQLAAFAFSTVMNTLSSPSYASIMEKWERKEIGNDEEVAMVSS
ncbi:hypothetical protein SNOG_15149 [Parastagonospora nodorum SN15]|uniref:Uncharacterized protein n=1 Tax=Phaeosphaeria nodorum (strain SN15 / ATCC MYA-4574 / FGSC 10173) TaxID=321614 RepID=Q0TZ22_PHANO|nr:hypothetical protein SNOG_15149 [Parastagonospora nodorum SN15]EAT77374.1 hypothetical protein SNOG_15149 [Parastagonospora nodorum SN15]